MFKVSVITFTVINKKDDLKMRRFENLKMREFEEKLK